MHALVAAALKQRILVVILAATLMVGGLLRDLAREAGATVVCATHDPLLIELADSELRLGPPEPSPEPAPAPVRSP